MVLRKRTRPSSRPTVNLALDKLTGRIGTPFLKGVFFAMGMLVTALFAGGFALRLVMPKEEVEVPNVLAKDALTAWETLQDAGLVPHLEQKKYHPTLRTGCIISQSPLPGVTVRKGRAVRLTVSQGFELVEAPNLVEMTLHKAEVAARNQGFELACSASIPSSLVLAGRVIAQSPSPGVATPRGAILRVVASEGPRKPRVIMPDLLGKTVTEGKRLLEVLRVEHLEVDEIPNPHHPEGTIITQSPPPLSVVSIGSDVSIAVAIGMHQKTETRVGMGWIRIVPRPRDWFSIYKVSVEDETGKNTAACGWLGMDDEADAVYICVGEGRVTVSVDTQPVQEWIL